MKLPCASCGIHWPEDFKATLSKDCVLWENIGLANLSRKYKQVVWNWLIALPSDEIWLKTGYGISVTIQGRKIPKKSKQVFARIKEYRELDDKHRRIFQTIYKKLGDAQ